MQADANSGQKIERGDERRRVLLRLDRQQPARGLQIAQAAGRVFDVRLQMVDRALKFRAAALGKARDLLRDGSALLGKESGETLVQRVVQSLVTGQKTAIHQADGELGVIAVLGYAIFNGV